MVDGYSYHSFRELRVIVRGVRDSVVVLSTAIAISLVSPPTAATSSLLRPPTKLLSAIFFTPLQLSDALFALSFFDGLANLATSLEMDTMLALRAFWAEACHVELAQLTSDMSLAASGALGTEAFVVVLTHGQLRPFLDVHVQALISILAVPVLIEELTFAHLPQIVLVEVVARITLLAQPLQPMLADVVIVGPAVMARLL
jgi:hypothetical protein